MPFGYRLSFSILRTVGSLTLNMVANSGTFIPSLYCVTRLFFCSSVSLLGRPLRTVLVTLTVMLFILFFLYGERWCCPCYYYNIFIGFIQHFFSVFLQFLSIFFQKSVFASVYAGLRGVGRVSHIPCWNMEHGTPPGGES